MSEAGLDAIPGSGALSDVEDAVKKADEMEYPGFKIDNGQRSVSTFIHKVDLSAYNIAIATNCGTAVVFFNPSSNSTFLLLHGGF